MKKGGVCIYVCVGVGKRELTEGDGRSSWKERRAGL